MRKLFLAITALGALTLLSFDKAETLPQTKWIAYCSNGKVLRFSCDCSQENANHFANVLCSSSN